MCTSPSTPQRSDISISVLDAEGSADVPVAVLCPGQIYMLQVWAGLGLVWGFQHVLVWACVSRGSHWCEHELVWERSAGGLGLACTLSWYGRELAWVRAGEDTSWCGLELAWGRAGVDTSLAQGRSPRESRERSRVVTQSHTWQAVHPAGTGEINEHVDDVKVWGGAIVCSRPACAGVGQ
eukprot:351948-Chlamydomonas_euryale.AAC.2